MTKTHRPEYHKALLDQATYPSATRRIKFVETPTSYHYWTGTHRYKIRKTSPVYPNLAIKERYAHEALRLGRRWAPEVVEAVVPIVRRAEGGFALDGPGEPVDYAVRMVQLLDTYWLHKLVPADKITQTGWGRLARFLAEHHATAASEESAAAAGRPEHFRALADEVFYQCKKYLGRTLTQAMLDMVTRPLYRYLDEGRKAFLRRVKKGRIVGGHGAFVPQHVYMRGTDVQAVAPLEAQRKFRVLDAASDVATMVNELERVGAHEGAELFLKRYVSASRDRELARVLPAYRALRAMRSGLVHSERMAERPEGDAEREALLQSAHEYFNLAVQNARQIVRPT